MKEYIEREQVLRIAVEKLFESGKNPLVLDVLAELAKLPTVNVVPKVLFDKLMGDFMCMNRICDFCVNRDEDCCGRCGKSGGDCYAGNGFEWRGFTVDG